MLRKVPAVVEHFPTFLTLKGFLSSMGFLMLGKVVIVRKGFVALVTPEGFLCSVN